MSQAAPNLEPHARAQAARAVAWGTVYIGVIIVGLLAMLARVVQLKVVPDQRLAAAAGTTWSVRPEIARRGRLLDRRGRVLALSSVGWRLFVDPQRVDDLTSVAVDIAACSGLDTIAIDQQLSARLVEHPDTRYVVLSDLLEDAQADALRQARLHGVGLEPRLVRHYPNGSLGRAAVGLVGFEHSGLSGFEHRFQGRLQEERGRLVYLRDVRRRPMWVNPAGYAPAAPGLDVHLSIDLVVQEMAEERLRSAVDRCRASGGRIVVLDCHTGELLALADVLVPRAGREDYIPAAPPEQDTGLARNRCAIEPYEPGSSFKPFIWAVATGLGRVGLHEVLPTPASGAFRTSQGRLIHDSTAVGDADWHMVLVRSLNSGMAIAAERLERRAEMQDAVQRFGFGRRTGCGIPGESPGIVTPVDKWSHFTQTSVSMGHEIAVTALQMVRAFSVFARDGTMPPLRVTAARPGDPACCANRVMPQDLALTVRDALRQVVEGDPLHRTHSDLYRLFGKSGTAQLPRRAGGGYHEDRYISSFIAGAPFEDPRLVVLCVIEDPDKTINHFGSTVAGPVVRDVLDAALQYLGVPGEK